MSHKTLFNKLILLLLINVFILCASNITYAQGSLSVNEDNNNAIISKASYDVNAEWSQAYKNFVMNKSFLSVGQEYEPSGTYILSLYDIDQDGTPEIKITNGSLGRSTRWAYLYTYLNGNIIYLGVGPTDAYYSPYAKIGMYGYYRMSPDEINCTLYVKNGVLLQDATIGTFSDDTWPSNLTLLKGETVDHIIYNGWENFINTESL